MEFDDISGINSAVASVDDADQEEDDDDDDVLLGGDGNTPIAFEEAIQKETVDIITK